MTDSAGFAYRAAMKHRALPVLLALFSLSALPFAAGADTPPSPDRIQPIAGYVIGGHLNNPPKPEDATSFPTGNGTQYNVGDPKDPWGPGHIRDLEITVQGELVSNIAFELIPSPGRYAASDAKKIVDTAFEAAFGSPGSVSLIYESSQAIGHVAHWIGASVRIDLKETKAGRFFVTVTSITADVVNSGLERDAKASSEASDAEQGRVAAASISADHQLGH